MVKHASMPMEAEHASDESRSNVKDVVRGADSHSLGREPNEIYDVVSVLYHALRDSIACERYVGDAVRAGDQELERFFRACRNEARARARRAKTLLVLRLAGFDDDSDGFAPNEPPSAPESP